MLEHLFSIVSPELFVPGIEYSRNWNWELGGVGLPTRYLLHILFGMNEIIKLLTVVIRLLDMNVDRAPIGKFANVTTRRKVEFLRASKLSGSWSVLAHLDDLAEYRTTA